MIYLVLGVAIFSGIIALVYAGRCIAVAVVPRMQFKSIGTLWWYAAIAATTGAMSFWMFTTFASVIA
jgi:hypothetical protein